jgi:hypothetical protein
VADGEGDRAHAVGVAPDRTAILPRRLRLDPVKTSPGAGAGGAEHSFVETLTLAVEASATHAKKDA